MRMPSLQRTCISLLAMFAATQLLSACCNCPDVSEYNHKVSWTGIALNTFAYTHDSTGTRVIVVDTSDFTNSRMSIRLLLEGEVLAGNRVKPSDWFGSAAYACKCDPITYIPAHKVTSLNVTTLFPFDATHPSGSLVTPYFKSPGYDSGRAVLRPLELPNFPDVMFKDLDVSLLLDARPEVSGPQRFAVEATLSNGTVFRDTTRVVRF